jgi:hypothetical protein
MNHRRKEHASHGHPSVPAYTTSQSPATLAGGRDHDSPAHFPSEHRQNLFPEKYFPWRSGEITRLEAFCDVVFGFALTLLVVSLEVPNTYAALMEDMRGFLPFAVCFSQLVMIWLAHYKFSRRYGLEDAYAVFLNMVLLFLVLLYVYPLKFVFALLFSQLTGDQSHANVSWHEASVLMRIYALGFASVFLLFVLMYLHAYRMRQKLGLNAVEVEQTRASIWENAILTSVGLSSLAVAFKHPEWAGWLFCVIGPALAIHRTISGKRVRSLAERHGPA